MSGLTSAGLEIPTLEELDQGIEQDIHSNVSQNLNLSSTSAIGQYKGSTASNLRQLWEGLLALHASWDLDQAEGAELDRLVRLTGAERLGGEPSTVTMNVTLTAGTYAEGVLVVSKLGDPTVRFSNTTEVTTAGGIVSTPFESADDGPVTAPAGTLTVIANPIVGFTAATNPADALLGRLQETDAELRRRQQLELARKGSTTVDAIRADLLETDDTDGNPLFDYVGVVENDTDDTDGEGRPPHSFEVLVVSAADDADIAQAILAAKPAGIRAYGLTTAVAYDSQSNGHTIGWSVATDVNMYVWVYPSVVAGQYVGNDAVIAAIMDYATFNQTVGADVVRAKYIQLVMEQAGVVDTEIRFNNVNVEGSAIATNWTIGSRQIARFDATRIVVSPIYVPGVP